MARSLRLPSIDRNTFLYVFVASFLVGAIAYINRYPLVYSDSGSYIQSSFTLRPSPDRPIGYGLIIRAVTWQSTLWTVVIFQSFMTSWLLFEVLRQFLPPGARIWRVHLPLVMVLLVCSSMPWYEAQIMPDAITPLLLLVLFLWFEGEGIAMYKRVLLMICLFFFAICHFSHVAMTGLLLAGLLLYRLVRRKKAPLRSFLARWTGAAATLAGAVAFVIGLNVANGYRPVLSPAANVFLCGRLCEDNIMHDFLTEHCSDRYYILCQYVDDLPEVPGDLIWGDKSILSRTRLRMEDADTAFAPVVCDLLHDPTYFGRYVRSAFVGSVLQLFQVNANSGVVSFDRDSAPYAVLKERIPSETGIYIHSTQAFNGWDMPFFNRVVHLALLVSVLILAWTWPRGAGLGKWRFFVRAVLVWVVLNAVVTSSLANVYDRLQSRVMWLVVMSACIMLLNTAWGRRMVDRYA